MKRSIRQQGITRSVILYLAFLFLLPLLLINIITKQYVERSFEKRVAGQMDQTVRSIALSISSEMQDQYYLTRECAHDAVVLDCVVNTALDFNSRAETLYAKIYHEIADFQTVNPFQYLLIGSTGEIFSSYLNKADGRQAPFYDALKDNPNLASVNRSYMETSRFFTGESYCLSSSGDQLYSAINIVNQGSNAAIVLIGMDAFRYQKILDGCKLGEGSGSFLLNSRSDVLLQGQSNDLTKRQVQEGTRIVSTLDDQEGYSYISIDNKTFVLFSHAVRTHGHNRDYLLVSMTPIQNMLGEFEYIHHMQNILIVFCFMCSLVLVWYLLRNVLRPIDSLIAMTKDIKSGNGSARASYSGENEMGEMVREINTMVNDLQQSIVAIQQHEQEKRRMELHALQAQMKPHFIRNILNNIRWMATLTGADAVGKSIFSLSNLLEYNFSDSQVFVSVKQEMQYIQEYLSLQQQRFQNRFTFEIQIEEEMLEHSVLKLTLQPIVENAIYHGVLPQKKMGHIFVCGTIRDDTLTFVIEDNGIGMDEGKVATLFDETDASQRQEQNERIALWNIKNRLALHYGENASISIASKANEGTRVILCIPAMPEGASHD